ncbi:hypothetical protein EV644_11022 [Kribbella orskensis]|uniref:Uncharacterized protein n=1 Tax=Kribbella orskensis TaxID=2512216 RepID=A0ABY2BG38_9ACTN|nr:MULTISPECIES: hypothetical protein [Kribbella]TCN37896.1 hypothetical protein EV642_11045 [Kribbella sp. VKM Ac-2500]TCO19382.1 hypothetical protein EV644_11022 [Kribbella orskensis]
MTTPRTTLRPHLAALAHRTATSNVRRLIIRTATTHQPADSSGRRRSLRLVSPNRQQLMSAGRPPLLEWARAGFRTVVGGVLVVSLVAGCSVARKANEARPTPPAPPAVMPTAVAPPQAEGLDGTAGAPGPQVCSLVTARLSKELGFTVRAKPNSWSDGGLPVLDLCTLVLDDRPVVVGVTALPKEPDSLDRLIAGSGQIELLPELGPEARLSTSRVVFPVDDRVVRVSSAGGINLGYPDGIDRIKAVAISRAVRDVVPRAVRNSRQSDAACQLSTSAAERFVGALVQLRRDYRVNGALTCIWGTFDATVSIVESFHTDTIPEAKQSPAAKPAPIGSPGYYLPDQGELVFRKGRRVVRVTGLTNPARVVPMETLLDIVEPMLPLFIR